MCNSNLKVQELKRKALSLPRDIEWHFIGHCQTNKVKDLLAIENLKVIETVDSIKLAQHLEKELAKSPNLNRTLEIFVQVNTSQEESKYGVGLGKDFWILIEYLMNGSCTHLKFAGLMTIGRAIHAGSDNPDFTVTF